MSYSVLRTTRTGLIVVAVAVVVICAFLPMSKF